MPYIYSTLSQSNDYVVYEKVHLGKVRGEDNIAHRPVHSITIKGGANVAIYPTHAQVVDGMPIHTPYGLCTKVTDDELELLQANETFKLQVKNGFIKVDNKKMADVDKAVKDLKPKDKSAPKTPKDYNNKVKTENGIETIELPDIVR